jgi:hypothetical protein
MTVVGGTGTGTGLLTPPSPPHAESTIKENIRIVRDNENSGSVVILATPLIIVNQ